jgi:hypothetical protein
MSAISLCIPRVFNNITKGKVYDVFTQLNLGIINSIDIVEQTNKKGESSKRVFIQFSNWYMNDNAQSVYNKLMYGKEIKIVYDDPWYWKVAINKNKYINVQEQYEREQYEREKYEREQYEREKQYEREQYERKKYEREQYEREKYERKKYEQEQKKYEREQYEQKKYERRNQYVKPTHVEREDNPDIYADDEEMIKRMKPINYSLIHIPVPKKIKIKIKK